MQFSLSICSGPGLGDNRSAAASNSTPPVACAVGSSGKQLQVQRMAQETCWGIRPARGEGEQEWQGEAQTAMQTRPSLTAPAQGAASHRKTRAGTNVSQHP